MPPPPSKKNAKTKKTVFKAIYEAKSFFGFYFFEGGVSDYKDVFAFYVFII
jgi:hypothetical protein